MNTNSPEYRTALRDARRTPANATSKFETYLDLTIETYEANGIPYLRIWKGNAGRPLVHYRMRNVEHRQTEIDTQKRYAGDRAAAKDLRKAATAAAINPYKVGDVLYDTWGYDQTNVDFFQVVEVGKKSVIIRPIASTVNETGFMSGNATPVPSEFIGEPVRKIVVARSYNGRASVHLSSDHGGCLSPYEGRSIGCSWYA